MKKNFKLFSTIASLCLAVALMAFGVWAANSTTLTINSKVSFTVSDVFVDVTGSVSLVNEKQGTDFTAKSYTLEGTNYTPATLTPAIWSVADVAMNTAQDNVTYTLTIVNVSKENDVSVIVDTTKILKPEGTTVEKNYVNNGATSAPLTGDAITVLAEKTLVITVKVTLQDKSKAITGDAGKVLDGTVVTITKA